MLLALVALGAGIALLAVAADQFVIGAARLARMLRVSAVMVGVVLVGLGTSLPEALVSSLAASQGDPEVGLGNAVGSNLANLSLLLGIGAVIAPIAVASSIVRRELPMALIAAVTLAVVAPDGITVLEGVALLVVMAVMLLLLVATAMRSRSTDPLATDVDALIGTEDPHRYSVETTRVVIGLIGTVAGSQLLLTGALDLAELLDLDTGFVGASIVAIGTSLPELVTVIQAMRRDEPDLVLGNLLGSNLFNSLAVVGLVGLLGGTPIVDSSLTVWAPIGVVALTAVAGVFLLTRSAVSRAEGAVLVAIYGASIWALA